MKKLRKLFNLLPAFALAAFSGLGVLIDNKDRAINETYADTLSLVSSFSQSVTISYQRVEGNNTFTITNYRTYNVSFYKQLSSGNFILSIDFNTSTSSNVKKYNGLTNQIFYLYRSYGTSFAFNNLVDGGFSSTSRSLSLQLTNLTIIDYASVTNAVGDFPAHSYIYEISELYTVSIDGFNTATVSTSSFVVCYSNAYTALSGTSVLLPSSTSLLTHNIDLSHSNYEDGFEDGYSVGYQDGFNDGYSSGSSSGYDNGYSVGYQAGVDSQEQAIEDAYSAGYSAGYDEGFSVDSTAATIFSGILQVGMLPINVLLAIFNFEILGINLSAFISAILTVCLTVIVIRTVTGGKNSE